VLEPGALEAGATQVADADDMFMVYVPAGDFLMGAADDDPLAGDDERPQRTVTLDAFWIDQTEVTNAMYQQCEATGVCQAPIAVDSATRPDYYEDPDFANFPVTHVAWEDAQAYCGWAGRRMPTEAEWEKAARGTDGRLYPWGNEAPDNTRLNFDRFDGDTSAVGSYAAGASPYGALDMAGNLYEWVADFYSETYYSEAPDTNPTGPEAATDPTDPKWSVRGGYWGSPGQYVRVSERDGQPVNRPNWLGIRCAMDE
jgi:eukaryotic-like serine/threonine-protein kinase